MGHRLPLDDPVSRRVHVAYSLQFTEGVLPSKDFDSAPELRTQEATTVVEGRYAWGSPSVDLLAPFESPAPSRLEIRVR